MAIGWWGIFLLKIFPQIFKTMLETAVAINADLLCKVRVSIFTSYCMEATKGFVSTSTYVHVVIVLVPFEMF